MTQWIETESHNCPIAVIMHEDHTMLLMPGGYDEAEII